LVVDFSTAEFVDSSILNILLRVDAEARDQGCTLRLQLATAAIVRRAFEVTGLLAKFEVVSTREAALEPRK
jgi:anti-anti-sigma regulatory factor